MPKGGRRKGAGRKPGQKNKATIEREKNVAVAIDRARKTGKGLSTGVLERMMNLCEDVAMRLQPPQEWDVVDKDEKVLRAEQWKSFGEWIDRVIYCAKELANYESPKLRAVMVAMDTPAPPAVPIPVEDPEKTIDLIAQHDPNEACRLYQDLIRAIPHQ